MLVDPYIGGYIAELVVVLIPEASSGADVWVLVVGTVE